MRDYSFVFFGDFLSKVLVVAANLVLIKFLTLDNYAEFTIYLTVVNVAYQVVCGVFERLYISEYEQFRSQSLNLLGLLLFVAAFFVIAYLSKKGQLSLLPLSFVGIFCLALFQAQRVVLQKHLEFKVFSFLDIFRNVFWFLSLILIIALGFGLVGSVAILTYSLAAIGAWLLYLFFLRKNNESLGLSYTPFSVQRSRYLVGELFQRKELVAYSAIGGLFPYMPILLFSASTNEGVRQLASLGAAARYQGILAMAVYAFNVVALPKLASLQEKAKRKEYVKGFNRKIPLFLLIFAALVIAGYIAIPLFDSRYPYVQKNFALLAMTSVLSFISTPYVNTLLLEKRYKHILFSMAFGLLLNLVLWGVLNSSMPLFASLYSNLLAYLITNMCLVYFGLKVLNDEGFAN